MRLFDLHCDTLYRSVMENKGLLRNDFHISLLKGCEFDSWIECFAVWISDDLTGQEASDLFDVAVRKFKEEQNLNSEHIKQVKNINEHNEVNNKGKCTAILTLEGSKALNGDVNRVKYMKECGVKVITLTWNGDCDIGSGCKVLNPNGLTNFGRDAISLMNEYSIIPDVSHASDRLFYDVANFSKKPIIATHSNSRSVCSNIRNLTDDQFKIIRSMGGIVGINFCKDFLNDNGSADFSDIRKHVEHFLSLSGENTLCIGSDFDGAEMPDCIKGIESILSIYNYFLECGYNESVLDNIFFNNAYKFFSNY